MTANRGLFVRNNGTVGTTPIEGRLVLASIVAEDAPGTPRQGLLSQKATTVVAGTANMTYDITACQPVLNRAANEGVYMFTLSGTTNVATTAAPGSGSRYDLIYVKQNDVDKGDTTNTAVVAVLQGTAAASPTKPYASLPAGAYVLAEALVNTGAIGTNGAQVTITQVWRYTALRGVPIPVRNTTERGEITATDRQEVFRLDLGITERYSASLSRWNCPTPLGQIAEGTTTSTSFSTTKITIGQLVNVPTLPYRKYRVECMVGVASNTAAAYAGYGLRHSMPGTDPNTGTQFESYTKRYDASGSGQTVFYIGAFSTGATGGSNTVGATGQVVVTTATCSTASDALKLRIYDEGPVTT